MTHKILVVEDDPHIQGFAKTALEAEGFEVCVCATAGDAGRLFAAEKPDLVIIDIGLPDGNGVDVCRQLSPQGNVPFVFLTARQDLKTRLDAFSVGGQDYLQKPFAVQELLARVKTHLKLKKSHDALIKRNYELELINRARQDLTDMIVHDLKTPLTSIKGTLDLIQKHGLITTHDHKRLVDNAGSAAEFMLLMLNDILDVGQAEQLGLNAQIAAVEVEPLFDKIKSLFGARCQRHGIGLEFDVASDARTVSTDQNLIFRVVVNLISNAVHVTRRGENVLVRCLRQGGAARFTVADRGPGVRDPDKAKIFEKYTTSKPRGLDGGEAGAGIGLAFCRLATYALKGKIWVEDREGGGSVFILELPQK